MVLGSARARGVPKSINFWCVFKRSENPFNRAGKRNSHTILLYCYLYIAKICCYRNLWKKEAWQNAQPQCRMDEMDSWKEPTEAGTQKGSHSMWWIQDSLLLSLKTQEISGALRDFQFVSDIFFWTLLNILPIPIRVGGWEWYLRTNLYLLSITQ